MKGEVKHGFKITKWTALIAAVCVILLAGLTFVLLTILKQEPAGNSTAASSEISSKAVNSDGDVITDPEKLSWLWGDYIFDSIDTIGGYGFTVPGDDEASRPSVVRYVVMRMAKKKRPDALLPLKGTLITFKLPSLSDVEKELIRYFNTDLALTQEEYDQIFTPYLDEEGSKVIQLHLYAAAYDDETNGSKITEVTYNKKNKTYIIKLDNYANLVTKRVYMTSTYVLAERSDGELYFKSLQREYPEVKYVAFKGGYTKLDNIGFNEGTMLDDKKMLCKATQRILKTTSTASGDTSPFITQTTFSLLDTETMQIVKTLVITDTAEKTFIDIRITPDKLIFKFNDSFYCTDKQFNKLEKTEIKLPEFISKNIDDHHSYDVSNDLKTIVYTDTVGLNSYSRRTGKATLIQKHITSNNLIPGILKSKIRNPMFTYTDQSIVSNLIGWESIFGTLITDVDESGTKNVFIRQFNPFYEYWTNIRYPEPAITWTGGSRDLAGLTLLDFDAVADKGEITFNSLLENAEAGKITLNNQPVERLDDLNQVSIYRDYGTVNDYATYNETYFVYVTVQDDTAVDSVDYQYNIVVMNLKTLKAKTVLSCTAELPRICAVTSDGRVIFYYDYSDERGFAITDKPLLD